VPFAVLLLSAARGGSRRSIAGSLAVSGPTSPRAVGQRSARSFSPSDRSPGLVAARLSRHAVVQDWRLIVGRQGSLRSRRSLLIGPDDRSRRGPFAFGDPRPHGGPWVVCPAPRPVPASPTNRTRQIVVVACSAPVRCTSARATVLVSAPSVRCQACFAAACMVTAAVKRPRHVARDTPLRTTPLARFAPPPATLLRPVMAAAVAPGCWHRGQSVPDGSACLLCRQAVTALGFSSCRAVDSGRRVRPTSS
jgi:hypothetical protein